jgi:hypothetical protein
LACSRFHKNGLNPWSGNNANGGLSFHLNFESSMHFGRKMAYWAMKPGFWFFKFQEPMWARMQGLEIRLIRIFSAVIQKMGIEGGRSLEG